MNLKLDLTQKKWFVVYTNARTEKKVAKRLDALDIIHYLPLRNELRQWKDRKKWLEVALFPSYLFVYIEDCKRFNLYSIPGFLKYISFAGQTTIISNNEIENIKRICNYKGLVTITKNEIFNGDEVTVLEGYFIGMRGALLTKGTHSRLRIKINELNCFAIVELDKKFVKKIL